MLVGVRFLLCCHRRSDLEQAGPYVPLVQEREQTNVVLNCAIGTEHIFRPSALISEEDPPAIPFLFFGPLPRAFFLCPWHEPYTVHNHDVPWAQGLRADR